MHHEGKCCFYHGTINPCESFHLILENAFNLEMSWNIMLKYLKLKKLFQFKCKGTWRMSEHFQLYLSWNPKINSLNIFTWWYVYILKIYLSWTTFSMMQPLKNGKRWSVTTPLWGKCKDETRTPKLQSSIAGVKTPCLEVFFIPLERSWSVDVENCMSHSNICNTSYGRKNGRESN
jgi:hypothetical protein